MASFTTSQLRVGVLVTFSAQLLDLAGIDLLGMLSKEYLEIGMPKPIVDLALDVQIYYIGQGADDGVVETKDQGLRELTAQIKLKAETSLTSPEVQPGKIDVLMIPGPPPGMKQPKATLDFVRTHYNAGTKVLVVCTGCYVAAQAGILDGLNASGPRGLISTLKQEYPKVHWDDERRWVKTVQPGDGSTIRELWSSGGVTNGLELVAEFIKEKYPGPLSEAVCGMAEVGDRGEYYDSKASVDNAWWLGQILRALFFGHRYKTVRVSDKPTT